jgi:peptide methionine sulfoxide reductase MsrA
VTGQTADRQEQDKGTNYNDGIKFGEWTEEHMEKFIKDFEETKRKKPKKKKTENAVVGE